MRIANPLYDAAFKYLMDDQAAARLLVGAVLGEEVVSLQPLPQERSGRSSLAAGPGEPPSGEMLTVRRVDSTTELRLGPDAVGRGVRGGTEQAAALGGRARRGSGIDPEQE